MKKKPCVSVFRPSGSSTRTYVDSALNRSLGRVGQPVGSAVLSIHNPQRSSDESEDSNDWSQLTVDHLFEFGGLFCGAVASSVSCCFLLTVPPLTNAPTCQLKPVRMDCRPHQPWLELALHIRPFADTERLVVIPWTESQKKKRPAKFKRDLLCSWPMEMARSVTSTTPATAPSGGSGSPSFQGGMSSWPDPQETSRKVTTKEMKELRAKARRIREQLELK